MAATALTAALAATVAIATVDEDLMEGGREVLPPQNCGSFY
jgi:hypothetical protein